MAIEQILKIAAIERCGRKRHRQVMKSKRRDNVTITIPYDQSLKERISRSQLVSRLTFSYLPIVRTAGKSLALEDVVCARRDLILGHVCGVTVNQDSLTLAVVPRPYMSEVLCSTNLSITVLLGDSKSKIRNIRYLVAELN